MDTLILNNVGRQPRNSFGSDSLIAPTRAPALDSPPAPAALRTFIPEVKSRLGPIEATECHTPELRQRKEDLELIQAIVTSKLFKQFERAFSEATGLPVSLQPVESYGLPLRGARNGARFCDLMARANRTCGACLQAQAQVAETPNGDPQTTVCYAGLSETAVPVRLGSRLIGFLWTGQVFQRKPQERQFHRIVNLLSDWGVNLDREALHKAYFGTQVVSFERHAAAVKLLRIFAEHLAMVSNGLILQGTDAEPPMIAKAKDFIRQHHSEHITLPQVAKASNTSYYYFCKLFKRATRLTFTQFVSRVRVESSIKLLSNPHLRVSEVAYAAGFQSLTHFNRVFQRMVGQSPTDYRVAAEKRIKSGRL